MGTGPSSRPAGGVTFRGPLRYEIKTSIAQPEAGRKFTVFVKIVNPYDTPVRILEVKSQVPVELRDGHAPPTGFWSEFRASIRAEYRRALEEDTVSAESVAPPAEQGSKETVLQPGNATLQAFTLRTRREITFTPSLYALHIQIVYEMDGTVNHDTVEHSLSIRAPLKAVTTGAVIGALVGVALRNVYEGHLGISGAGIAEFVGGVLLAAVLVVAFGRKKDAQPFIVVEDLWGGFFVGFVAGYVGQEMVKSILPPGVR